MHIINLDLFSWTQVEQAGDIPEPRVGHSAAIFGSDLFLFGGETDTGISEELITFDCLTKEWKSTQTRGDNPTGLAYSASILLPQNTFSDDSEWFIFGGYTKQGSFSNSVYFYNFAQNRWQHPSILGEKPKARQGASAVHY